MKKFFKNYTIPDNLDVLFLLVLGILLQMTDGSPFSINERWTVVWNTEIPAEHFSLFIQKCIKTVLSAIVVVRCLTTYAYVVSAMLVIFSILKKSIPKLMLLWLLVSGIKSVCMTFLEALTGVYVCSAFGKIRKACVEFFICKAVEIIFAAYLWGSVLNIYQEMERKAEEKSKLPYWEQLYMQKANLRRHRVRSLLDESTLYKTACLNYFEFKDVPQIILQMLRRENDLSQDSLLDPGMMLASVSNLGSFDNLKTSQSLGELGLVDLKTAQVVGLEEEDNLSPPDKALKFLKLTWSDVGRAKRNKYTVENDIYRIEDETWKRVTASGAHINMPKHRRAEVFMSKIPQLEYDETEMLRKKAKKSIELKFGISLFNFFEEEDETELHPEENDGEDYFVPLDEEEVDEDELVTTPIFMSNIREEGAVNRIRLDFVAKTIKGNTYANLYKQDWMSVIGPEVFDKATKLPKVTSLTKITRRKEIKSSVSLPILPESSFRNSKKLNFSHPSEKGSDLIMYLKQNEKRDTKESNREKAKNKEKLSSDIKEKVNSEPKANKEENKLVECKQTELSEIDSTNKYVETSKNSLKSFIINKINDVIKESRKEKKKICLEKNKENKEKILRFNKRRIKIKIMGRRVGKRSEKKFSDDSFKGPGHFGKQSSQSSLGGSNFVPKKKEKEEDSDSQMPTSNSEVVEYSEKYKMGNSEMYFITELLQKSLTEVLFTYHNLKSQVNTSKQEEIPYKSIFWRTPEVFEPYPLKQNNRKIWKSNVLKEAYSAIHNEDLMPEGHDSRQKQILTRKFFENNNLYFLPKKSILSNRKNYFGKRTKENSFSDYRKLESDNYLVNHLSASTQNYPTRVQSLPAGSHDESKISFGRLSEQNSESYFSIQEGQGPSNYNNHKNPEKLNRTKISNSSSSYEITSKNKIDSKISTSTYVKKNEIRNEFKTEENLSMSSKFEVLENAVDLENPKSENSTNSNDKNEYTDPEAESNVLDMDSCDQESEESFSLYYSKTADLASPLLDMSRFIYPDHIHYSYKHVKKKGFDVDITGGLPLLVRESLTMNSALGMKNVSASVNPDFGITRKPMDLSFASTNNFAEWQSNDQTDAGYNNKNTIKKSENVRTKKEEKLIDKEETKNKKSKKMRKNNSQNGETNTKQSKTAPGKSFTHSKPVYTLKDYLLIQKLMKMHAKQNAKECRSFEKFDPDRTPIQISSTQLHSNKGRISSTYNPAIYLQENKSRNEKKKVDSQEERTKDMFARLEREAMLQCKNVNRSFGLMKKKSHNNN